MSVGLVLGAGGVVGQAYHAGVLAALELEKGWDARDASLVVGTSAGSITATLLRIGVSAADMAASATGDAMTPEGSEMLARVMPDSDTPLPQPSLRELLRPWRLPSTALLARAIRRPLAFRPDIAAVTLLPRGLIEISDRAKHLDSLVGTSWPDGLWICASRRDDGARVVFGRHGSPSSALAPAVLASCAIPAYFAPISIGGVEYFDGGVYSATNADVLRNSGLDTVVVVSPMSAGTGQVRGPDALLRWGAHRRLLREVARLKATGTRVVRIEPGARSRAAMGLWAMAEDRSGEVVRAAYEETARSAFEMPFVARQTRS